MAQTLNSAFCRDCEEVVRQFLDSVKEHKFTPNTWSEVQAEGARLRGEQFLVELIELTNDLRDEEKE